MAKKLHKLGEKPRAHLKAIHDAFEQRLADRDRQQRDMDRVLTRITSEIQSDYQKDLREFMGLHLPDVNLPEGSRLSGDHVKGTVEVETPKRADQRRAKKAAAKKKTPQKAKATTKARKRPTRSRAKAG